MSQQEEAQEQEQEQEQAYDYLVSANDLRGSEYQYIPGMEQLAQVVVGLQKDVKRINQCLTLKGAEAYGKKKGWNAHDADITGPKGKPDGIREVFLTDKNGNIRVVNGWTLKATDYPHRKMYMTQYDTKEKRKKTPYNKFMNDLNVFNKYLNNDGYPTYANNIDIPEFANVKRTKITPKEYFKQFVFNPFFENYKLVKFYDTTIKGKQTITKMKKGISAMDIAKFYNKALSACYINLVGEEVIPAEELEKIDSNKYNTRISAMLQTRKYINAAYAKIASLANTLPSQTLRDVCDNI